MPANATPTSTTKPKSLRSTLTRRRLPPCQGPRLAVAVSRRACRPQAALQVVEHEAHRRLRLRDGRGGAVALDDDEDAPVLRRRLELHELRVAGVRNTQGFGDERRGRVGEALRRQLVG